MSLNFPFRRPRLRPLNQELQNRKPCRMSEGAEPLDHRIEVKEFTFHQFFQD